MIAGRRVRLRTWLLAGAILAAHIVGFGGLAVVTAGHPELLGTGLLAYVLGLRHAFDADHIAAIDNVTRKFRADGNPQSGSGFFFALGHSSVVGVVALALAVAASSVRPVLSTVRGVGGVVAMGVSGGFLALVGAANLVALVGLLRVAFGDAEDHDHDHHVHGFLSRFAGGWFERVHSSWQLYPVGVLFGLGFDTVSEMTLLATATAAAGNGLSVWSVMVLPVLFCAGMTLLDTADGVFMTHAYDWAFATAARRIYYNLTVTSLSVVVALGVGGIELLSVLATTLGLHGGFWGAIRGLDLGSVGYLVVGLFVATWGLSFALWKLFGATGRIEKTTAD